MWVRGGQGGCVNFFQDRAPFQSMRAGDIDDTFKVAEIGAMEVYTGSDDTPAEFKVAGKTCATVVVWTRAKLQKS
jgi:hypothetical protein